MGRNKGSKNKVKHKKKFFYRFPKKPKGRKTELKLYFWKMEAMSKEGYKRFDKDIRPYMTKVVYKPFLRIDAPVERIASVEAIKELALEVIGQTGVYVMRGMSHGKTKTGFKWVRLALIKITEHPSGLKVHVSQVFRLSRYWFYHKS